MTIDSLEVELKVKTKDVTTYKETLEYLKDKYNIEEKDIQRLLDVITIE